MARFALGAQKSAGQNPAPTILCKLFYDEIRQRVTGVALDWLPKRKPVVLDDFVERGFFGPVPTVVVPFDCSASCGCVCHCGQIKRVGSGQDLVIEMTCISYLKGCSVVCKNDAFAEEFTLVSM